MPIALLMAGSNIHGRMVLEALLESGVPLDLVIDEIGTERAEKLQIWLANSVDTPRPITELIADLRCKYVTVSHFHGADSEAALQALAPDYVINGGCGILKRNFLDIPSKGFLNAHPGLLPEFRGVDPVLWAISEGAPVGATIHMMTEGIDEGAILLRAPLDPLPQVGSLLALRLACMRHAARLLARVLKDPDAFPPQKQDESRARYFSAFPAEGFGAAEIKLRGRVSSQEYARSSL